MDGFVLCHFQDLRGHGESAYAVYLQEIQLLGPTMMMSTGLMSKLDALYTRCDIPAAVLLMTVIQGQFYIGICRHGWVSMYPDCFSYLGRKMFIPLSV